MDLTRLTQPQLDLAEIAISEMVRGGHLLETRSDVGDWYLVRTSSGRAIPKAAIEALCATGALEPSGDGLFGDSQSYRLTGQIKPAPDFKNEIFGKGYVCASRATKTGQKAMASGLPVVTKTQLNTVERLHHIASKAAQ